MSWAQSHIVQLAYLFEYIGQFLPVVLTVAIIFTFFLVQSLADKISRMTFYLDRIDNHLREITYFIKDHLATGDVPRETIRTSPDTLERNLALEESDSPERQKEAVRPARQESKKTGKAGNQR